MQDPALNRIIEDTVELHKLWQAFHQFMLKAWETGKVPPAMEMKFLELKSQIAMLHDGFMQGLEHDQKTGQNIMQIVSDIILLQRVPQMNDAERQKFEFDWNECFLLLTEQISLLNEEKERLAGISEKAYRMRQRRERMKVGIQNFFGGAGFKLFMFVMVLVLVFYVIPAFIWSYRNLREIPGVSGVYVKVVNRAYRPFLNQDYAFDRWEDVPNVETRAEEHQRIEKRSAADLNYSYFVENTLWELGLTQSGHEKVTNLLENRKNFTSERYVADGSDVHMFYILLPESRDAADVIDTVQQDFNRLPPQRQDSLRERVYLHRWANLIAIGVGNHPLTGDQIANKFHGGERPEDLL